MNFLKKNIIGFAIALLLGSCALDTDKEFDGAIFSEEDESQIVFGPDNGSADGNSSDDVKDLEDLQSLESVEVYIVRKEIPIGTSASDLGEFVEKVSLPSSAIATDYIVSLVDVGESSTNLKLLEGEILAESNFSSGGDSTTEGEGAGETCSGDSFTNDFEVLNVKDVEGQRNEIISAARICNFAALGEFASDQFTSSFGQQAGPDNAVALWTDQELAGDAPMLALLRVLSTTPDINADGTHTWPRFFNTWQCGQEPDEAELIDMQILDFDPVNGCDTADGYLGYRTSISPDNGWAFFVEGD